MNKQYYNSNNTKERLLYAACSLIKKKGFDKIVVEDITKKAGVAKGTFYTYFKRKEDIVLEISRKPFDEITLELEKMADADFIERLIIYFKKFIQCVEECGLEIYRQWIRDIIVPERIPKNIDGEKWNYDVLMLSEILNIAIQNKELKPDTPVGDLTHIIITELYGMMTCWCISNGIFKPSEHADKFCKIQLKQIFKPYLTGI